MKVNIGLDIGVASVGWAVVDENKKIIELGSNLFDSSKTSSNIDRRNFRGSRRLIRRKASRLRDFDKLWGDLPKNTFENVLELKVKALSKKVSIQELYAILKNSLKFRGITYLDDVCDDIKNNDYGKNLKINQDELKNKFPCEIQLERMSKFSKYRGITIQKEGSLLNVFTHAKYKEEVETILNIQSKYHKEIDSDFKKSFLEIFDRKREYYEGPGNELSRTDYGIYTTDKDENGKYKTDLNIFEKLIGNCSIYSDQRRAAKWSYTAQYFNVLNDLNNIRVNDSKLTVEQKKKIIEEILDKNKKQVSVEKIISKVYEEDNEDVKKPLIKGVVKEKNGKNVYHSFESFRKLRRYFIEKNSDISKFNINELDKILEIITLNTDKEGVEKTIGYNKLELDKNDIELFINFMKKYPQYCSGWHNHSLKLMNELIPEMLETDKNSMQIITERKLLSKKIKYVAGNKYIPSNLLDNDITNPVVRKSVRISFQIVNELIKKYKDINQLVIEMPRDKNSADEKYRIEEFQKNNAKEIEEIEKKIKEERGIDRSDLYSKKTRDFKTKLRLWNEQEGRSPYSGKPIEIENLKDNPSEYEIDHIIPLSISFDDSRTNKVLVESNENQTKANNTPYSYLNTADKNWNYLDLKNYVNNNKKFTSKKKENLLTTIDITKKEVLEGFINRNINDTRYASRLVLNNLQDFFKNTKVKVKVIRGSFTYFMRKNFDIKKNRDEYFHHAIDAVLIVLSQMGYDSFNKIKAGYIDSETGEIINQNSVKDMDEAFKESQYQTEWHNVQKDIMEAEKRVKYWHKVDKKVNRQVANQTIYGTRIKGDKIYKISKFSIRKNDSSNGKEAFKKHKDVLLMKELDLKTYNLLCKIFEEYSEEKNPFIAYEKETGQSIRKYSKNGDGPIITNLKYYDGEANNYIDISHKYGLEKDSKKALLMSLKPYRTDIYYDKKKEKYNIIGLKYSDVKFKKGIYFINEDEYIEKLVNNKILKEGDRLEDLSSNSYEFVMSLYKNEIIKYTKDGDEYVERHLSCSREKGNQLELKPIDKYEFEKRRMLSVANVRNLYKINVDILGNRHKISHEKLNLINLK